MNEKFNNEVTRQFEEMLDVTCPFSGITFRDYAMKNNFNFASMREGIERDYRKKLDNGATTGIKATPAPTRKPWH